MTNFTSLENAQILHTTQQRINKLLIYNNYFNRYMPSRLITATENMPQLDCGYT